DWETTTAPTMPALIPLRCRATGSPSTRSPPEIRKRTELREVCHIFRPAEDSVTRGERGRSGRARARLAEAPSVRGPCPACLHVDPSRLEGRGQLFLANGLAEERVHSRGAEKLPVLL